MPRIGWVACGALGAAWLGTEPGLAPGARLLLLAGAGLVVAGLVLTGPRAGRRGVARRGSRPLAGLLVGIVVLGLRLVPAIGGGTVVDPPLPAGSGPWVATVVAVSAPRDGEQRAVLRVESGGAPLLAASLPRYPPVAPSDRVVVAGSVRPPPDGDYGRYLDRSGIAGTLRARSLELEPAEAGPGRLLEGLRRRVDGGLALVLPEPEAGLASGILVGLRERVDRGLAADFTTAGASHVVAISGWNIAIVGACVAALLRGRGSRRARSLVTVGAIAAYTAFAGASASVVRAAVMAAVVLVGRESGRGGSALAALGGALLLLLLIDPALARDVGLQLSALATAGLIAWGTPLTERLGRIGGGRLPRWLTESLGVSLAAQAATLPLILLAFGRLSLVAPLANLLIVPLVPVAMATGAIAAVAGLGAVAGLPVEPATLTSLPCWAALAAIVALVRLAASVPFASVDVGEGAPALAAIVVAALVIAGDGRARAALRRLVAGLGRRPPRRERKRPAAARTAGAARGGGGGPGRSVGRVAVVALALGLGAVLVAAAARPDGPAVVVLDVGQGDAILVEGGRGGRLLVDTGGDPDRLLVELGERIAPWDRRLDAVVVTHPHEDHLGGLPLLLERYRIGRVLATGRRGTGPAARVLDEALASARVRSGPIAPGTRLRVDEVELVALWPPAERVADPGRDGRTVNDASVVLLGRAGARSFLLTGDVEEDVDPALLAAGIPRVELLKVAHHGSRTATSDALLARLRPSVAVVSVGAGNGYGHPSPATLHRLGSVGARVFRTDLQGTIEVALRPGGLVVRADRETPPGAGAGTVRAGAGAGAGAADLYHRPDDRSRPRRRGRHAALAPAAGLVPPPLACGRGDRRLARARRRRERCLGRSPPGGGGRAPP